MEFILVPSGSTTAASVLNSIDGWGDLNLVQEIIKMVSFLLQFTITPIVIEMTK